MTNNGISIIIPVHNEELHLPNLLESIKKYLKQKIDYQIIIVLNGCVDNSHEISEKYECDIVLMEFKVYPSLARNKGVEFAKYDVLAFIDADVVITEQWSKRIIELIPYLNEYPQTITGDRVHIPTTSSFLEKYWFGSMEDTAINYINGANIVTTQQLFHQINGFDENIETAEDEDFSRRAMKIGANFKQDRGLYTIHNGYPKNLRNFVRRERWHGIGDFQKLDNFLNSKVALITLLFMIIHIILFGTIIAWLFTSNTTIINTCVLIIIGMCLICSIIKFTGADVKQVLICGVIFYFYFFGHSLAFYDVAKTRFKSYKISV